MLVGTLRSGGYDDRKTWLANSTAVSGNSARDRGGAVPPPAMGGFVGRCQPGVRRPGPGPNAPPPPVSVAKPVVKEIVEHDDFIGRFDAVDTVDLRARVSGYLDKIHFTDGALVKQATCSSPSTSGPIRMRSTMRRPSVASAQAERRLRRGRSRARRRAAQIRQHHRADRRPAPAVRARRPRRARPGPGGPEPRQARHGVHRDPRADRGPHLAAACLGRQPRQRQRHAAQHDRVARPDPVLFRRRRALVPRLPAATSCPAPTPAKAGSRDVAVALTGESRADPQGPHRLRRHPARPGQRHDAGPRRVRRTRTCR